MDLENYLDKFYFRTFFLPKPVQKRLAAALPGAVAAESSAQTRSAAEIGATQLRQEGENFRTGLTTKARRELEEMSQAGETKRTGMRIKGAMDLQRQGYDFDIGKILESGRVQEGILDRFGSSTGGDNSYDQEAITGLVRDHLTSLAKKKKKEDEDEPQSYYEMYNPAP